MAGNIGPINPNTTGLVGGAYGYGANAKPEEGKDKNAEQVPLNPEQTPVAADKVLDYLAKTAVAVAPKTVDPSKYVDAESEARIAAFMGQFEDIVAQNLAAITSEFPGMSEKSAMAVALSQVSA